MTHDDRQVKKKNSEAPVKKNNIPIFILPILAIALLTAIDQLTKYIIAGNFVLYETKKLIPGIISLTYIRNAGVAWGMFQGGRIIFLVLTVVVLFLCFYLYSNISGKSEHRLLRMTLVVLVSGALGNMLDRIRLGYVIDFFDVDFIDFPVFNIADIYVVISMICLFALIIFKYDNEDIEELLNFKKNKSHTNAEDGREED